MAMSVAFPPVTTMHCDPVADNFLNVGAPFHTFSCGFESHPSAGTLFPASLIKTEPVESPMEDRMESSFLGSTYTELSPTTLSQIKQGHADLYPPAAEDSQAFSSWAYKHPENWDCREVLDWVFSLTDGQQLDGASLRGEAYNSLTGRKLCGMSREDFLALDRHNGATVHQVFNFLLEDAKFQKPLPPDSFKMEPSEANLPRFDFLDFADDIRQPRHHMSSSSQNDKPLSVFVDSQSQAMKVNLDGLGQYDIDLDITIATNKHNKAVGDDSDYHSGSEAGQERRRPSVSSDVFEPLFSDEEDASCDVSLTHFSTKIHASCPSYSSDSGCESEDKKCVSRKRQPSASKGNHLWEFIRDLLKDPLFNPNLVRWEDKEEGVFKFVQSEAVAQLWGRKKNNPQMTYEKLSRAMRFCRSAGYFSSVPKTGRFPKKLCFKFGHKAHGWQQ